MSTLGQAALNLAVSAGASVTATTRKDAHFPWLRKMGAVDTKRECQGLDTQFDQPPRLDKVLDLIGNTVLLESTALARPGGRMLQAGWLGGLDPVPGFNPMLQMEAGVHFTLFHSKVLGSGDFSVVGGADAGPARVFGVGEMREAHGLLDSGAAGGKIVVRR